MIHEIYSSIQSGTNSQIKIEGSRFIAESFPVTHEEEAKIFVENIRKKYYDATHHSFAYIIGVDKKNVRYSDDGEPSGTAGVKIFSALEAKNLSDILLVVIRYFGGTKLGVGGLGRAYFDAAEECLKRTTIISKAAIKEFQITFPFAETNPVMNIINAHKLKIAKTEYAENSSIITLHILPSQLSHVEQLFSNATRGSAQIKIGNSLTVVWQ